MKIAVIGGNGKLGLPVAKSLKQASMDVSILTHHTHNLQKGVKESFDVVQCDVINTLQLADKLNGFDAVHINLAGKNKKQCFDTLYQGTLNIIQACKNNGIQLISFISGARVSRDSCDFYDSHAKYLAEQAIINSGIPYLIFCPSWFMESLPNFAQANRVSVFGPCKQPIHWLAVSDYCQMLVKAYCNPSIRNQRFILHGKHTYTLVEALHLYLKSHGNNQAIQHTPYWLAGILSYLTKDKSISYASDLCRYYEIKGDIGSTKETQNLLGEPEISLALWCELNSSLDQYQAA